MTAAQTPHDAEWLEYDDDTRPAFEPAPPVPPGGKPPEPPSAAQDLDCERTSYALWFRTETRPWQQWSSERKSAVLAATQREGCLAQFPDAETVVVKRHEKIEALSSAREANLTRGVKA